jgi:hypothetical protein
MHGLHQDDDGVPVNEHDSDRAAQDNIACNYRPFKIGDHVICWAVNADQVSVAGDALVGDILRMTPSDPFNQIDVHIRGNVNEHILGPQQLAWIQAGTANQYFRNIPFSQHDRPCIESVWIMSIIAWSCNWCLLASSRLPRIALGYITRDEGE